MAQIGKAVGAFTKVVFHLIKEGNKIEIISAFSVKNFCFLIVFKAEDFLALTVKEISSCADLQFRSNAFDWMLLIKLERFYQCNAFDGMLSKELFWLNALDQTLAFDRTLLIECFQYILDVNTTGNFFHCSSCLQWIQLLRRDSRKSLSLVWLCFQVSRLFSVQIQETQREERWLLCIEHFVPEKWLSMSKRNLDLLEIRKGQKSFFLSLDKSH